MYRIVSGESEGFSETIVAIRLHGNGCYVPCAAEEAEGFCAKIASRVKDEERGEERIALTDTVFALHAGAMRGTEPVGKAEEVNGAEELEAQNIALGKAYTEGVNSVD